jgi:hypothetical protein
VKAHRSFGVRVFDGKDLFANLRSHAKFLVEFPREARFMCLSRFALAAGELPLAGEVRPFEPARHQEAAIFFDDRGEDNDGRSHRGVNG